MTESVANVFEAKISFKVLCETIDGVKTARIDNPGFTVGGLDFNLFALCPTENFHGICTYLELTEACKKMLMDGFDIEGLNMVPDDKTDLWLSPLPASTSYGSALLCVVNEGAQCDATLVMKFHDVFPHRLQFVDEEAAKEKMSDCKIVLEDDEDKPVYVVKKVLAMNSPFFKTMFFGDFQEKDQDVVKLGGIKETELLEYLCCVYPPPNRPFSFVRLESLYRLADRFQNEVLMTSIKSFMMEKKTNTSWEKRQILIIADAYDMPEVFLSTLKTMDKKDLKELSSMTYKKFKRENIERVMARIIRLL